VERDTTEYGKSSTKEERIRLMDTTLFVADVYTHLSLNLFRDLPPHSLLQLLPDSRMYVGSDTIWRYPFEPKFEIVHAHSLLVVFLIDFCSHLCDLRPSRERESRWHESVKPVSLARTRNQTHVFSSLQSGSHARDFVHEVEGSPFEKFQSLHRVIVELEKGLLVG